MFTAQELAEMAAADAQIEAEFRLTPADLAQSRELDRLAGLENLPTEQRRKAAYQREYREANREKVAAYQREYRKANREKAAAYQREYYEANREKVAARQREYRKRKKEEDHG